MSRRKKHTSHKARLPKLSMDGLTLEDALRGAMEVPQPEEEGQKSEPETGKKRAPKKKPRE